MVSSHTQEKGLPPPRATTQTSLNFHLLWNVVRRGHKAIFRNLFYFSVTAVCLHRQFERLAVRQARLEEVARRLT